MSKEIHRPQDCMDYRKVESFAKNKGCDIRMAKGDHAVIMYGNNQVTYCRREMGLGIGCKIFKFFKTLGLLTIIGLILVIGYAILYHSNLI